MHIFRIALTASALAMSVCFPRLAHSAEANAAPPVARFAFDEGIGQRVCDSGASPRDATATDTGWVKRDNGFALEFNGATSFVDCGDPARLGLAGQLTVAAWVCPKKAPKGEPAVVGEGANHWGFTHHKGRIYFYAGTTSRYAPVPYHRWTHVTGVYDGATVKIYVNGQLRGSREVGEGRGIPPKRLTRWTIGGGGARKAFYNGLVDDVRVYARALPHAEVAALADTENGAAPLSPAEMEAGRRFFTTPRRNAESGENGRQTWLANEHVGVEVVRSGKECHLARVYDVKAGVDLLHNSMQSGAAPFWKLVLRRDQGRDEAEIMVDSDMAASVDRALRQDNGAQTLRLSWYGLPVREEANALDVEVTVTIQAGDPLSRWRIDVKNRSKTYGLWDVVFPFWRFAPIGGRAETNALVLPRARGSVAQAPFNTSPSRTFGFGANSGCWWPGTYNMQFHALYDNVLGRGAYFSTHDDTGARKQFFLEVFPEEKALAYRIHHATNHRGDAAEDYRTTFDTCLGPFRGDWYDAAQTYRAWATKVWAKNGPLSARKDIPKWFKECPMSFKFYLRGAIDMPVLRERMMEALQFIGPDLPVVVYGWKKHFPEMSHYNKDGSKWKVPDKRGSPCGNIHDGNYPTLPAIASFAQTCKEIAAAGGRVMPYVCAKIYDQGLNENAPLAAQAKPHVIQDIHGNPCFAERGDVGWYMCSGSEWWQKRMAETVTELIKREHARGIYFDTFYGGHGRDCYSAAHGHKYRGGVLKYEDARKLSEVVRGAMKATRADTVMSGENPAETAVDLLDGFLYRRTLWPDMAPVFAAVYGDYVTRTGIEVVPGAETFYIACATLFTEGAQIGRIPLHGVFLKASLASPTYAEHAGFLRKIYNYWKPGTGGPWLAYGKLLRPITFTEPAQMPTVTRICSQAKGYQEGRIVVPAVQSGVFATTDGNVGVFLINIAEQDIPVSFELRPGAYPLDPDATYRIVAVNEQGQEDGPPALQKGGVAWRGSTPAHDIVFVRATQQGD